MSKTWIEQTTESITAVIRYHNKVEIILFIQIVKFGIVVVFLKGNGDEVIPFKIITAIIAKTAKRLAR